MIQNSKILNRKDPPFGINFFFLGVLLVVGLVGIGGGTLGAVYALNRPTRIGPLEVTVQKGMTVADIAHLLHQEGIIRSPKLLRLFSLLNGTSRRLTAGVHPFHGGLTSRRDTRQ